MEFIEIQKNCVEMVNKIDKKLNINHDDGLSLIHITEELGEVSRQIINPLIKRDKKDINNLKEELADLIFFISKIADNNKINLENAVIEKIQKLKLRHNIK